MNKVTRSVSCELFRWLRSARNTAACSEFVVSFVGPRRRLEDRIYVGDKADILIDGFPRSSNSFAKYAFLEAQNGSSRVASHFHAVGHFKVAIRIGVPALLVVRNPTDVALSYSVFDDWITPRWVLAEYIRFHRNIEPLRERIVVADFDEVTSDFGAVIDRINHRFETTFARFEATKENIGRVQETLAASNRRFAKYYGSGDNNLRVASPTKEKDSAKDRVRIELKQPKNRVLLSKAQLWYERTLGI